MVARRCGSSATPSWDNINHTFAGHTSLHPNITQAPECGNNDDVNVVAFGAMDQFLAVNCTWYLLGTWETHETDIMLNTNYRWTVFPDDLCVGAYDVEAVMTHERGHTFGIDHVSEIVHSRMTMSTHIDGSCQAQERWIGQGDFLGLVYK